MKSLTFLSSRREAGKYSPLVMALTGSTGYFFHTFHFPVLFRFVWRPLGIGKSETAKLLGKGFYGGGESDDEEPCGLLIISGKDYSSENGMTRLQVTVSLLV
jgi:hypothetical protein